MRDGEMALRVFAGCYGSPRTILDPLLLQVLGRASRHMLSVFNFLGCMKTPPQFVVNRWQKDYNLRRSLPCSSSDIVANGPVGRYDSLYKHCIKFAELGAVSEDLYDSALKIISEATEELISSDYTAGDVFPRISSTMNRRSMVNEVDDIHDLGQVRRKGQPPKKRKESLVINLQQARTRETPPGPWAG